jgi:hypothetical protein
MSVRKRLVARALAGVPLLLLLAALGPATGQEAPAPTVEQLRGLVRELTALELAASDEETRWRREKAHLLTTRTFLRQERDALDARLATIRADETTAGEERQVLLDRIAAAEARIRAVDAAVRRCAKALLAVHAGLPDPLRTSLRAGAARLRGALATGAGGTETIERLRLVAAFSADLDRTLSTVHATKQILEIEPGDRREVDVLYLGGAVGFWVGPHGRRAGRIVRAEDGWTVVRRDELAETVKRAVAILAKERPAEMVSLPLLLEGDR